LLQQGHQEQRGWQQQWLAARQKPWQLWQRQWELVQQQPQ
jgi:hypothetical protein